MRVCVYTILYIHKLRTYVCIYIYTHHIILLHVYVYIYTMYVYRCIYLLPYVYITYIYIQYMHIDSISREWVYTFEHPDAHNLSKEQNHVPWHRHAFPSAWRLGEGQRHRSTDSPMGCEGSCKRPRLKPIRMQIAGVPSADRFDEKPKMNRNCRKDLGKGLGWNMELL